MLTGYTMSQIVFVKDGSLYCVSKENVVPLSGEWKNDKYVRGYEKLHNGSGRFFMSYTLYLIIGLLFLGVMVLNGLALKLPALLRLARIGIPLFILLGSLLEVWAYMVLGTNCFWWCDKNHYGFWGSLVRIVPFALIVAYQLFCIKLYEPVLFGSERKAHDNGGISVKPAFISLLVTLPVIVLTVLLVYLTDIHKAFWGDWLIIASVFISVVIGFVVTWTQNSKRLSNVSLGLFVSLFSFVYAIGCIVAVWGLVVVVLKLFIQLLLVGAVIAASMFFMVSKGHGGGGGSSMLFYDKEGHGHRTYNFKQRADVKIDHKRRDENIEL